MEAPAITIRGLINDLMRTLTGSLVHMDNLLLQLNNDYRDFDDAFLANDQLGRALEFFIELRSEFIILQESINQKKNKSYKFADIEKLTHNFNNLLEVVVGLCDMVQKEIVDDPQNCYIINNIYKSIQNSYDLLNETISPLGRDGPVSRLNLSYKKRKLTIHVSNKSHNLNDKILLVEDDDGVKGVITKALCKEKYTVIGCSKGEKALAIFERSKENFVLCIVDVGLPDILGPDLVSKFLLQKPSTNVLFTSGYNETNLRKEFPLIGPYPILIKPFRIDELLNKMRSMIY